MSGHVLIGGKTVHNSYVADGRLIEIDYATCHLCGDQGVIADRNGEPEKYCSCATGDAVKDAAGAE